MAKRTAPVAPVASVSAAIPAMPMMPAVPTMPGVPTMPAMPVPTMPVAPSVPVAPVAPGSVAVGTPLPPVSLPGSNLVPTPPVAPVAATPVAPVAPVIPLTPSVPEGPIGDDEFEKLLEEAESLVPTDTEIEVQHLLLNHQNRRLIVALHDRNTKNRLLKDSLVASYSSLMLTNVKDNIGNPIIGVTGWNFSLPVIIFMDNDGNMHNGQHCTKAFENALLKVERNQQDIAKGIKTDVDYAKLGISLDSLQLHLVLVRGIDPDAADFIDTNRPRKVSDVAYRNRDIVFAGLDYSKFAGKDGSFAGLDAKKNSEANYLATALKIIAYRKWYNGEFVRGGSVGGAKFEGAAFNAAFQEFPQISESVHRIFLKLETDKEFKLALRGSGKKAEGTPVHGVNISVPYLMASHYLAAMAYATPSYALDPNGQAIPDGKGGYRLQWTASPEAFAFADGFIDMVVRGPVGGDPVGRYNWINRLRDMFRADARDEANEVGQPGALPTFSRDNSGLKMIWNALGWAFRNYINPADLIGGDGELARLKQPESYHSVYGDGSGFDIVPERKSAPPASNPTVAPPQNATPGVAAS